MPCVMRAKVDPVGEKLVVYYEQDVEPILRFNHAVAMERGDLRVSGHGEWQHIARIPEVVCYLWEKLYGFRIWENKREDKPKLMKILNDPDWQKVRTAFGRF